MSKGKYRVHFFESNIYPPGLFIVCDNRLDRLQDTFEYTDGCEIDISNISNTSAAFVPCHAVVHKESENWGVVIVFKRKAYMTVKNMAHESFHATSVLANILGFEYKSDGANEEFAYLMGWIMNCCNEVKNAKYGDEGKSGDEAEVCLEETREEGEANRNG